VKQIRAKPQSDLHNMYYNSMHHNTNSMKKVKTNKQKKTKPYTTKKK